MRMQRLGSKWWDLLLRWASHWISQRDGITPSLHCAPLLQMYLRVVFVVCRWTFEGCDFFFLMVKVDTEEQSLETPWLIERRVKTPIIHMLCY